MKIERFDLDGPVLFTPKRFEDDRGYFMETFRQSVFNQAVGADISFVQSNQSWSRSKGTVRGLHCQAPPHAQGKLVSCCRGRILDVAVDVRANSPTFGQYVAVTLSSETGCQFWIPAGFLHGFSTLTDDVVVQYQCTDYYSAEHEMSVVWDDADLAIDWGVDPSTAILSDKDRVASSLTDFLSPFQGEGS